MSANVYCRTCGHPEERHLLGWRCDGPRPDAPCHLLCGKFLPGGAAPSAGPRPSTTPVDWQSAERFAAEHMRSLGFTDAAVTASGPDGGIDVSATGGVAQVKHYSTPVGSPVVQQLRGTAYGADWALVYALSGFTRAALATSRAMQVALFSYTATGDVVPISPHADSLVRGGFVPLNRAPSSPAGAEFVENVQRYAQAVLDDVGVASARVGEVAEAMTPEELDEAGRLSRRMVEVVEKIEAMQSRAALLPLIATVSELDAILQRLHALSGA
ncbi:restriction endonuclease [Cellulosimicrobium funkei]|uniref:restriction endonuclease n=1 Tax=Cellulosimicrobium funkei TaxID=264251 RepID=UPI003789645E